MIRISGIKLHIDHDMADLESAVLKKLRIRRSELGSVNIIRRSLDARHKDNIRYVYTVEISAAREEAVLARASKDPDIQPASDKDYVPPAKGDITMEHRPCVIGAGPAGLFCAYFLAEYGFRPILIEQGESVDDRKKTVDAFLKERAPLDPLSNIQFGEGGAGAFSDGKLMSAVKDISGRKTEVLKIFAKHGAPEEIVYSAKPHVGTDVICRVVKSMREHVTAKGGTVLFRTKFTGFTCEKGKVSSITVVKDGQGSQIPCSALVLAIGHSSRDTIKMLYDSGMDIEAKPFAVGVRVQHLQEEINKAQYGNDYSELYGDLLPAADYKLTARTGDGRAVYSFCMCPGGYVINSSSEAGMLCVNGMSYSGRKGENANSAIIVSVSPGDVGALEHPLAGIDFQRCIEKKAYIAGNGRIPTQRLEDFAKGVKSPEFGKIMPQMKGYAVPADINEILPGFICEDIKEAMGIFGKTIRGFDDPDTLISAPETRTSSPVRILRDDSLQSIAVKGIYPCGEGAGYAGGITSSAIDGIKVFEEIYRTYRPY